MERINTNGTAKQCLTIAHAVLDYMLYSYVVLDLCCIYILFQHCVCVCVCVCACARACGHTCVWCPLSYKQVKNVQ